MDNKNIFASNLQKYMHRSGKSRRDICADLGFSYYTFSDWVNGKKYPRMDKVEMLANYFGILKSDLIEDKKEKPVESDELSEKRQALIDFALSVPEDKAALVLKVLKSLVEEDE